MVSVRIGLAAALVMAASAAGPLAAVASAAETPPETDLSRFESTAADAGLSVTVDRRGSRLRAERDTTYTITVENRGEQPVSTTIRVALPPWMAEVAAEDNGEVVDGVVEWPVTMEPDSSTTLRLIGAYTSPADGERAGGPIRVAFTACALDQDDGQPIVCATDIAELKTSPSAVLWLLIAAGAAVLAAAVAALLIRRRRRRPVAVTGLTPTQG